MTAVKKPAQPMGALFADPAHEWVDVTPELAADWLKLNTLNRPKKPQKIRQYVAAMKEGHWPMTGATISFGKSGRLLDGQNRLQAIIESGATIRMLIVRGLEDAIFDVIDGGSIRTSSDVLVIEGYSGWCSTTGGTAAKIVMNMAAGRAPNAMTFSPQNIRRFVSDHPDVMSSVAFIETVPRRPAPMPHSAAAALHYFMAQRDSDAADLLMTQLYRGDSMSASDMVLRLRNNLLGKVQQKNMVTTNDIENAMAAVVRVWNSQRAGRNIVHIQNAFLRGGEGFPEIR